MSGSQSIAHETLSAVVRNKVRNYITENFLLGAADKLHDASPLMESGVLDSTGAMELGAFLQESFDITIEEDEIVPENLNSIDSICAYVLRKSE